MLKKKLLFLIILCISGISVLNADCKVAENYGENLLNYVKRAVLKDENNVIKIYLFDEQIYVKVKNDFNNENKVYTFDDKDDSGLIVIDAPTNYEDIKYTIETYYTDTTCGTEPIKTYELHTGTYNALSDMEICWDKGYLEVCKCNFDSELTEKYKDVKTEDELTKIVNKQLKEYEKANTKLIDIVKKYYLYVLIPFLIVSCYYITKIIIAKRKKGD